METPTILFVKSRDIYAAGMAIGHSTWRAYLGKHRCRTLFHVMFGWDSVYGRSPPTRLGWVALSKFRESLKASGCPLWNAPARWAP